MNLNIGCDTFNIFSTKHVIVASLQEQKKTLNDDPYLHGSWK